MLEYLNSAACSVLFSYCFVMAYRLPRRGFWLNRLMMCGVAWFLMAEIIQPWSGLLSPSPWQATVLHTFLAAALLVWRKEALLFIKCKFTVPTPPSRMRRQSDFVPLDEGQAAHVSGGRKE
jgi:hypothetical protein